MCNYFYIYPGDGRIGWSDEAKIPFPLLLYGLPSFRPKHCKKFLIWHTKSHRCFFSGLKLKTRAMLPSKGYYLKYHIACIIKRKAKIWAFHLVLWRNNQLVLMCNLFCWQCLENGMFITWTWEVPVYNKFWCVWERDKIGMPFLTFRFLLLSASTY